MKINYKIGLALSGGGYRATAFHLGTLKKLHQLGILSQIGVISSISGGSITAASYCLDNQPFEVFEQKLIESLRTKSVIKHLVFSKRIGLPLLGILGILFIILYFLFTNYAYISIFLGFILLFIVIKFQFKILPFGNEIEKAYDQFFFSNKTLSHLSNEKPTLVIGSTNLSTSRPFTFSKTKMYDSTYENGPYKNSAVLFKHQAFPVARAVVASTCIPVPFTPVLIGLDYFENPDDFQKVNPKLIDGGIYDNQGIHKITQKGQYEAENIIVSDAGYKLPDIKKYNNSFSIIWRTIDVFMERIKNFQMVQHLYSNVELGQKPIAYFSLSWDLASCIPNFVKNLEQGNIIPSVIEAHKIPPMYLAEPEKYSQEIEETLIENVGYQNIVKSNLSESDLLLAQNVGTNLTALSAKEIQCLMQHAENLTELQIKLYCPNLLKNNFKL